MALSTNYQWAEPDNSSLVKNGAQDIRTLGNAIDTSLWNSGFGQAGKNKIINGNFGVWQRGTSFAATASTSPFTADRWQTSIGTGAAATISQQAFTAGAAPISGYESAYFLRFARTTTGSSSSYLYQKIEDVRTFAGQTATVSFWAKAASTYTFATGEIYLEQTWGTGGTAGSVVTYVNASSQAVSTSWTRYSFTVAVPAATGKTIGTSSALALVFNFATGQGTSTFDIWGVQVEAGSTATPFQTATGTIQGELAACQRYYYRMTAPGAYTVFATGGSTGSTNARFAISYPVTMRVAPTALDYSTLAVAEAGGSIIAVTSATLDGVLAVLANVSSGLSQYRSNFLYSNNSTSAYLGFSAEL